MKYCLLLILLSCLSAAPAFSAIPLITDDTGTQGKGKFQIELFGEYGQDKDGRATNKASDLSATVTYGLMAPIDIVFSIPYQAWRMEDGDSRTKDDGMGDMTIETKWRFAEVGSWSFALKPGLTIPAGDDSRGLGTGKATYHVLFITTYNSGEERFAPEGRRAETPEEKAMHHIEWTVHFNAGYTRNENTVSERTDLWFYSVAGTVEFVEDFYVVADLGAETNTDRGSGTDPTYLLAGLIYSPEDNIDLGLGLKLGLNSAEADYMARGGITYRF